MSLPLEPELAVAAVPIVLPCTVPEIVPPPLVLSIAMPLKTESGCCCR
jgi:hypothetical protein